MLKRAHPVEFDQEAYQIKRQRCSPFKQQPGTLFNENENQMQSHQLNVVSQSPLVQGKRRRTAAIGNCRDEYLYTQQDFSQLQQQCNLALQAFKTDMEGKIKHLEHENAEVNEGREKLAQENKILRSALITLNRRNEDGNKELRAASSAVELLQHKIKQLEKANLQLMMQMQQSSCGLQDSRPWDPDNNGGGHIY